MSSGRYGARRVGAVGHVEWALWGTSSGRCGNVVVAIRVGVVVRVELALWVALIGGVWRAHTSSNNKTNTSST